VKGSRAHRVQVPRSVTAREDLAGADRALTYELPTDAMTSMTPEQWARGTFEGAPPPVRWFLVFGFKFVLGLELQSGRSPDHVLGWQMSEEAPDTVILRASSCLIDGCNIATEQGSSVLWTTLVRYKNGLARLLWRTVEPVHAIILPYILTHAGRVRVKQGIGQDGPRTTAIS
jgi:hypothetical protein